MQALHDMQLFLFVPSILNIGYICFTAAAYDLGGAEENIARLWHWRAVLVLVKL